MKRSLGVTCAAVVALIGSILTLLLGLLMAAVMVFALIASSGQSPTSPGLSRIFILMFSFFYILPAGWGIATSIGVFRLKNWACISMIVFAALLSVMGLFTGLSSFLIPLPQSPAAAASPAITVGVKVGMAAFWLTLLGIGIWWLVLFTRSGVKAQFVPAQLMGAPPHPVPGASPPPYAISAVPVSPQRPLSISIIAWLMLIGCVLCPLNLLLHFPAVFFTKLVNGWAAALFYLTFAVVHFFVGRGLLQLKPRARQAAIALYIFGFVNTAVFHFAPGGHARVEALMERQSSMFWWEKLAPNQPHVRIDPGPLFPAFAIIGLVAVAVPIYFLVTRKAAFEANES